MTTYRVPVTDAVLHLREHWPMPEGLRFISADEAGPDGMYYTVCTFEDDTAPPELEGKLVLLELKIDNRTGATSIGSREVVAG